MNAIITGKDKIMTCQAIAIKEIMRDGHFYCEASKEFKYDLIHATLYNSASDALAIVKKHRLQGYQLVYVQLKEQVICY